MVCPCKLSHVGLSCGNLLMCMVMVKLWDPEIKFAASLKSPTS